MKKSSRVLFSAAILCAGVVSVQAVRAEACAADTATMLPVSSSGTPLEFFGFEISRSEMARLWEITTTRSDAYLYLGKVIGEGQSWFDSCQFPGLGIATGSGGGDLMRRYVALWVWADGVDLAVARVSIYNLIADVIATTTTSTSTSVAETTTTTTLPAETTTTLESVAETTTTTTELTTTTTTMPEVPVTLGLYVGVIEETFVAAAPQKNFSAASVAPASVGETTTALIQPSVKKKKLQLKIVKSSKRVKVVKRGK